MQNQRLSDQLLFDSSRRVVQPQFNQGLRIRGAGKQNFMVSRGNILHTNLNAILEEAIGTFMHTLAHQEKIKRK